MRRLVHLVIMAHGEGFAARFADKWSADAVRFAVLEQIVAPRK
jgi:hypothetical protein